MDSDNTTVKSALAELRRRLPPGWSVEVSPGPPDAAFDASAVVFAPDRRFATVAIEAKRQLDPRGAVDLAYRFRAKRLDLPLLVVTRYLTPTTRERLRESNIGYADSTGNVRLAMQEPGLYIEATGAESDPQPEDTVARSLKGSKAGRVVRALVDFSAPSGVRELATRAEVDPGYVSRLLALLDREALIEREGRGRVARVEWQKLVRRWAEEAPLETRGTLRSFLEPRGVQSLIARLPTLRVPYAATGSFVAGIPAPIAPTRSFTAYVTDLDAASAELGLRPIDRGANVVLIQPDDAGVFERATEWNGVRCVAFSQAAADLLTSPGRGPAEGEELLQWMERSPENWRA